MIDRFSGEYRFLSNFYPSEIRMDGLIYPTVEHAFQASKTLDSTMQEICRLMISPGEAKRFGRMVQLRPDWEEVKLDVMLNLLRAKFLYPDLAEKLLATNGHTLVEGNTWGDRYWGVCRGTGENHLGRLLMKVREETQVG